MSPHINIQMDRIKAFCTKWKIAELSLFGSALRDDFGPQSDVDLLVGFATDASWDLFDLVEMRDELKEIFGHKVDLVEKGRIGNPFRHHAIMTTREILYAA